MCSRKSAKLLPRICPSKKDDLNIKTRSSFVKKATSFFRHFARKAKILRHESTLFTKFDETFYEHISSKFHLLNHILTPPQLDNESEFLMTYASEKSPKTQISGHVQKKVLFGTIKTSRRSRSGTRVSQSRGRPGIPKLRFDVWELGVRFWGVGTGQGLVFGSGRCRFRYVVDLQLRCTVYMQGWKWEQLGFGCVRRLLRGVTSPLLDWCLILSEYKDFLEEAIVQPQPKSVLEERKKP